MGIRLLLFWVLGRFRWRDEATTMLLAGVPVVDDKHPAGLSNP